MIHPDDRDAFLQQVGGALERRQPYNLEFRVLWPDGSVHWTHGAGRAFYDEDGRPQRMIGTGQDITERRSWSWSAMRWSSPSIARTSGGRRSSRSSRTSCGRRSRRSSAHRRVLARPTNPDLEDRRRELLDDIVGEAGRLDRIVSDLVVLSQAERGVLDSVCEPLELRRIVQRVVHEETRRWPEVTFSLEVDPALPVVLAEQTYVEQVLRNMVGNAAKYGRAGGHVEVACARPDPGRASSASWTTVPASRRRCRPALRALLSLAHLRAARQRVGIGLFVCARLVEAMGGRDLGGGPARGRR